MAHLGDSHGEGSTKKVFRWLCVGFNVSECLVDKVRTKFL